MKNKLGNLQKRKVQPVSTISEEANLRVTGKLAQTLRLGKRACGSIQ